MLRLKTVVAFFMVALSMAAGPFCVEGVVTDSIGEGEPFATLRVFTLSDSVKPAVMGLTGEDGSFRLDLPRGGDYRLNVSATGKDEVSRVFAVDAAAPCAILGEIPLSTPENLLGVVEVTAQRPLVSREIDRIGYDVQADSESKTTQLDEMLKKVPLVTVEADGTVKVKGSTDFKIYKNGRPNNSFTKNAKDIFKSIPASMIKKIEVITDPGAREEAEGVGAILNIVTLENTTVRGVMGSAGLNFSSVNLVPQTNIWLTSQVDKVTFSVSGGLGAMNRKQTKNHTEEWREYEQTGDKLFTKSTSRNPGLMGWGNGELSYEIDSLNLITAEFGVFDYSLDVGYNSVTEMTSATGETLYSYRSNAHRKPYGYLDFNGSANYQHLTRRKGETFTLSYAFSTTRQRQDGYTDYVDAVNFPLPYTRLDQEFDLRFAEHTVQADWSRPFGNIHKLDVGGKFIYRDNHSITDYDYRDYRRDHTDFTHATSISALYADYRASLGRWSFRGGLRYEYSHLSAKFKDGTQSPFSANLNDIVPSASMAWNATDASSFKLSYSSSIRRPGIAYLNPAVSESVTEISQGNPDLKSARYQNVTFTYGLIRQRLNLNFGLSYGFTSSGIIQVQETTGNITRSTYANDGRNHGISPSLYLSWTPTGKTSVMMNINTSWSKEENPSLGLSASGWSGYAYCRLSQKLPAKINLSVNMNYWRSGKSIYNERVVSRFADSFGYGLGIDRSFLKDDRLTVRISAHDFFMPRRRYESRPVNMGYTGRTISYSETQAVVFIGANLRFGSLNVSVKKVAKSISNDDLEGRKN